GHPEAWFTQNGLQGPTFVSKTYVYGNRQPPTTLWYHDHSLGLTRLNMNSGLAGMYIIRDPKNSFDGLDTKSQPATPRGAQEVSPITQDRSFNKDGSLFSTPEADNPDIHPYWDPEFFGNTIMVNGKTWPNLDVARRMYRFRILDASNARFYHLTLSNG